MFGADIVLPALFGFHGGSLQNPFGARGHIGGGHMAHRALSRGFYQHTLDVIRRDAACGKQFCRHTLPLCRKGEQQVLGADIGMPQRRGNAKGVIQYILCFCSKAVVHSYHL